MGKFNKETGCTLGVGESEKGKRALMKSKTVYSGIIFTLGMNQENPSGDQDDRSGWIYVPARRSLQRPVSLEINYKRQKN